MHFPITPPGRGEDTINVRASSVPGSEDTLRPSHTVVERNKEFVSKGLHEPQIFVSPGGELVGASYIGTPDAVIGMRTEQQDRFVVEIDGDKIKIAVIDGMGGSENGQIAAEELSSYFHREFRGADREKFGESVDKAAGIIHQVLASRNQLASGACYMAVFIDLNTGDMEVKYQGDVQICVFGSDGKRRLLSEPHNEKSKFVKGAGLTEEQAEKITRSDLLKINNCVGWDETTKDLSPTTIKHVKIANGDTVIIATDGVWDAIPSRKMEPLIAKYHHLNSEQFSAALNVEIENVLRKYDSNNDNRTWVVLHNIAIRSAAATNPLAHLNSPPRRREVDEVVEDRSSTSKKTPLRMFGDYCLSKLNAAWEATTSFLGRFTKKPDILSFFRSTKVSATIDMSSSNSPEDIVLRVADTVALIARDEVQKVRCTLDRETAREARQFRNLLRKDSETCAKFIGEEPEKALQMMDCYVSQLMHGAVKKAFRETRIDKYGEEKIACGKVIANIEKELLEIRRTVAGITRKFKELPYDQIEDVGAFRSFWNGIKNCREDLKQASRDFTDFCDTFDNALALKPVKKGSISSLYDTDKKHMNLWFGKTPAEWNAVLNTLQSMKKWGLLPDDYFQNFQIDGELSDTVNFAKHITSNKDWIEVMRGRKGPLKKSVPFKLKLDAEKLVTDQKYRAEVQDQIAIIKDENRRRKETVVTSLSGFRSPYVVIVPSLAPTANDDIQAWAKTELERMLAA